ncbi:hypothetical protein MYCTH_2311076 [Thermothelomyces thermophilus ATCC 42464]|uniref:Uncharacterized protein n=1 Tax=Thermothelomyces thermophilus (strain ATCC 42464 / BCRC 31852 / DSM 1799) TaxID=573729 RepID=G2QMJ2_THET4|nr:uncharacterized protein MYCTH_2311076 [Thermothelomyces thermophilus ATCC 42464]AEO61172.1 hypothetical protein MYCTH_2311076 [Thermothelomyces thermophilus ATCC 42464]
MRASVLSPVLAGLAALASLVAAAPIAPGNDNPAPSLRPAPPRTRIFAQLLRRWGKPKGKGKGIAGSSGSHGGSKLNIWEPGYVVFERPGPWTPTTTTTTTPTSSSSTSSFSHADWDAAVVMVTVTVTVVTATETGHELGATTEPSATAAALSTDPGTTSFSAELAATDVVVALVAVAGPVARPRPVLCFQLCDVILSRLSSTAIRCESRRSFSFWFCRSMGSFINRIGSIEVETWSRTASSGFWRGICLLFIFPGVLARA